jgi:hypothetical protein
LGGHCHVAYEALLAACAEHHRQSKRSSVTLAASAGESFSAFLKT